MADEPTAPRGPGLAELPGLLRAVVDRFIDLATARVELAQAELRDEVRQWIGRAVHVLAAVVILLLAFALVTVGIVAWLSRSIGLAPAAFLLAALYGAAGVGWLLWFRATGGLNPPETEEKP